MVTRPSCLKRIWSKLSGLSQSLSASEPALFGRPARYTTASSHQLIQSASSRTRCRSAAPLAIVATGFSGHDQDYRRALQSLFSGNLPRADSHHIRVRVRLHAILPDRRAAARRVDEAASGRAPCGMALRDRQTRWQGCLGGSSAPPDAFNPPGHQQRLTGGRQRIATNGHRQSWISFFGWST